MLACIFISIQTFHDQEDKICHVKKIIRENFKIFPEMITAAHGFQLKKIKGTFMYLITSEKTSQILKFCVAKMGGFKTILKTRPSKRRLSMILLYGNPLH